MRVRTGIGRSQQHRLAKKLSKLIDGCTICNQLNKVQEEGEGRPHIREHPWAFRT